MTDIPKEQPNPFQAMRAQLPTEPVGEPGYLQYWDMRAEADPEDARVANIVKALTHITLRGETDTGLKSEVNNRSPALQARMWYRCLGPLTPMDSDAVPDLIRAAELTYMQKGADWQETTNLRLDNANILTDLERATDDGNIQRRAIGLGLGVVNSIREDVGFDKLEASTRLRTDILQGDLTHDALRLRHLKTLKPGEADLKAYREYERAVVQEDLRQIAEFGRQVETGVGGGSFGTLFEWYFILARRFEAWSNEELDITRVRGATSREDAEWKGEFDTDVRPGITANHDVVIEKSGDSLPTLLQLKVVDKGTRQYHPRITVVDYREVMNNRLSSGEAGVAQMIQNLNRMRANYQG